MQEIEPRAPRAAPTGWPDLLLNGSQMGALIHAFDWQATTLGPLVRWPLSLRAYVGMMLDNSFPMYIFWGPSGIALYNDAYITIAGDKHPVILGRSPAEAWPEVLPLIESMLEHVKNGHSVTVEDRELTVLRYNFPEHIYVSFCYAPLRDDDGSIGGVHATVIDATARVLAHRRLETLRTLASHAIASRTQAEALAAICSTLNQTPDVTFTSIYLTEAGTDRARLAVLSGETPETWRRPWIDSSALAMPGEHCIAQPITGSGSAEPMGILACGTSPHLRIDDAYREFVHLIAAHIAHTLAAARALADERDRAEAAKLTRTIERIQLFAGTGQQLFWTARADGEADWFNPGWYEYTGQTSAEALDWGWKTVQHPDDAAEMMRLWTTSLRDGVPFEMTLRLRGKDGRYRWFLTRAVPEFDGDRIARWYGTNMNIDVERRARQQLDFFARLGNRIGQNLDRESALRALSDELVRDLADWTIVNLQDEHGRLVVARAHHRDAVHARALESLVGTNYDVPGRLSVSTRVFQSAQPIVGERISVADVRAGVNDHFGELLEDIGAHSFVTVPIVAHGITIGTFHAIASESNINYTEDDVPFFLEIGRRMGFAIRNAELYERESRIARVFQAAALPAELPDIAGLTFSSLYEPGSREANVGGDFYDAFRLLDGRTVISIGDVAGTGIAAATTMAALRQSVRAVAGINPDPAMILRACDAVFADAGRPAFASAFVAVIDPLTNSIQYSNAGHPTPIVRRPDGSIRPLGASDLLLGLNFRDTDGARHVGKAIIEPGSLLTLYTDGLTEATYDALEGEKQLVHAIESLPISSSAASTAARSIRDAVLGVDGVSHDDTALLTVFFADSPRGAGARTHSWRFACADAVAAHHARDEMSAVLAAAGLSKNDIFAAESIFSELVGNGLRHAGEALDVILDLTGTAPVLNVLDAGNGFSLNPKLPADAFAEHGRGLYIIMQLARDFTVSPRTSRSGSHARAVLHGRLG